MVASSPFFKAKLGPNFEKTNDKEIVLHAINDATLDIIVSYCYCGSAQITIENVDNILAAASSVELVRLKEKCANFWRRRLNIENLVKVLLIADQYELEDLRRTALQFVCANFGKIPDIVNLDQNMFGEVLKQHKIDADETEISDCLVRWTKHDALRRSQYVAALAKSIRLEHLPTQV